MNTPLATPVRQAKLGIASTKSLPLANEYKKLLGEQHQRLWMKHQQDLDLIDDIRGYVKARLSIERTYTSSLIKLSKQHSSNVAKKFSLLNQCDPSVREGESTNIDQQLSDSDSRLQKRLANNGPEEPEHPCSLYKVWSEHINRLQSTSQNRAEQFEQLLMVADKLKDIRSHKASMGKKCLDAHLKRIHEDIIVSMVDVEKSRKLYYEDESQAKKARENEEKIKKKRSGLLTKFTDLQAKKERTSAQREANDIQSTQARNDYIMALAAGNAHLQHYYQRDLSDFIHLIDDGVLDHCKIFMATLSECDINSLKFSLTSAQYWSKMINLTGSQRTNTIFLECNQSSCLRSRTDVAFDPCNNDPIQTISLEHNADYALQHEIDKWFTWFKKECRNLSQLMHQLETCQRAFTEGRKSIELNGQTTEDLESKIIDLKQQIRKSEAAKLKAQARLKVIKEGGMQIEEWGAVEDEIRADMARAQEEAEAKRAREATVEESGVGGGIENRQAKQTSDFLFESQVDTHVQLQVPQDSDDSDAGDSIHNLASVSRSTSNLVQKQQNAISGYSALTDPTLVWQDDYSSAWGNHNVVVTETQNVLDQADTNAAPVKEPDSNSYDLLGSSKKQTAESGQDNQNASMTVQSSSPLSAIVDGAPSSPGQYQGMMSEAYKSDYECDYNRSGHPVRSAASSVEPFNQQYAPQSVGQTDPFGRSLSELDESKDVSDRNEFEDSNELEGENHETDQRNDAYAFLNRKVVAIYPFDKTNADDLAFNENDVLCVIEISDSNWVKARNDATGEEGYAPASYLRPIEGDQNEAEINTSHDSEPAKNELDHNVSSIDSSGAWNMNDSQQKDQNIAEEQYCRALYDHEPEADTYEDDCLPHLAIKQGELMRIIDQGEDDGWWLVEKEETGTRGHVPSMLVEEVDFNADQDEYDDDDASEGSEIDDIDGSIKAMPTFEPPVLQASVDEDDASRQSQTDSNNNVAADSGPNSAENKTLGSSLVATSYIIIEPTPEVSSRSFGESLEEKKEADLDSSEDQAESRPVVIQGDSSKPPTGVSYSVVNENFVLEGPTREPHHTSQQIQHHETPTIMEDTAEEIYGSQDDIARPKFDDDFGEPDVGPPVAVFVETCEDKRRESWDSDSCGNEDEAVSANESDSDKSSTAAKREVKHSGNVDVDPILRHRADEFSKQIIAEAIMLAPGADVGPSTSTANLS